MALYYTFLIVENNTGFAEACSISVNNDNVLLEDHIVYEIFESLTEIPSVSFDPHTNKELETRGISTHSLSRFEGEGLKMFVQVLEKWTELWSDSPNLIRFSNGQIIDDDGEVHDTYIDRNKAEILKTLKLIINMINYAISNNKALKITHLVVLIYYIY